MGLLSASSDTSSKESHCWPKTVNYVYIGHAENSAAHRFYIRKFNNAEMKVGTITESNEAKFFEDVFPFKESSCLTNKRVHIDNTLVSNSTVQEETEEVKEHELPKVLVLTTCCI